jgi:hypothetical protein
LFVFLLFLCFFFLKVTRDVNFSMSVFSHMPIICQKNQPRVLSQRERETKGCWTQTPFARRGCREEFLRCEGRTETNE